MQALDILRNLGQGGGGPNLNDRAEQFLARMRLRTLFGRAGFAAFVLAPTLLASIYFGLWASDQYVSEASIIVRGVSSSRASGLEVLFRTFGISRTVDDTNVVQNFILSRDAVQELQKRVPLREMFATRDADLFTRFPPFWRRDNFETMYVYYLKRVTVITDQSKGLTTVKVSAFHPEDAHRIAVTLLTMAEELVNRMNERILRDSVDTARAEVAQGEKRLIAAQTELTSFRNRELLVDPSSLSLSRVETITSLSKELSLLLAQIQESQKTAPTSPILPVLRAKSDALQDQVKAIRGSLAGDDSALANKVSEYERLTLSRELAEKSLGNAEAALGTALTEARRQQIYIENVVEPNLPDDSLEPERFRSVSAVFIISFAAFAILWILSVGAAEHTMGGASGHARR
jgi:capsular polysaccharide transport system permease protein